MSGDKVQQPERNDGREAGRCGARTGEALLNDDGPVDGGGNANEQRGMASAMRRWASGFGAWLANLVSGTHTPAQRQVAFTIAFVGLAAKMAKADGVAVDVEAEAFEHTFHVPEEERATIKRVYDLASQDVAGFEIYAERIAKLLADEPRLLRDVFEALFTIAAADGILHEAEEAFLRTVAEKFALPEGEYVRVRRLFVAGPAGNYDVLGVPPDIPDADLKARYRDLVRENHPDRLAADGVPREFLVIADRKLAAINAAYDAILKERGLAAAPASDPARETAGTTTEPPRD